MWSPNARDLGGLPYRGSLARNKAQIAKAFKAIAHAPVDKPVVVHCRAG